MFQTRIKSSRGIILIVLIVWAAILTGTLEISSQPVRREEVRAELREKLIQLRNLIENRTSVEDGRSDVSRAMELGKQARETAMAGNSEKAMKLIDEAIALVDDSKSREIERSKDIIQSDEVVEQRRGKQKIVKLKVNSDKVIVTSSVPGFRCGKEISSIKDAFPSKVVKVKDGKVTLSVSSIPIFVEEGLVDEPTAASDSRETSINSPFGGHPTAVLRRFDRYYKDIGVKWIRYPGRFMAWDIVERNKGEFNWSVSDTLVSETYENGINILLTVKSYNRWDQPTRRFQKGKLMKPKAPSDLQGFIKFLTKAVERYDGDGIDDAPGSPVVNYWQIENEVDGNFWDDTPENYARLLKASYKAVKKANPNAKVLIAGASTAEAFYKFYVSILKALRNLEDRPGDRYFDIFDIHWYGNAGEYKEINGKPLIKFMRNLKAALEDYGYRDIPIWITETGTHGGKEVVGRSRKLLPEQDEVAQASELVKRYVYFISNGISKVFWFQMLEKHHVSFGTSNDYFENVGLINNPKNDGDSSEKLSYFSYKFLIEKLEGSKWEKTERVDLERNVYAYRFTKDGKRMYILWFD